MLAGIPKAPDRFRLCRLICTGPLSRPRVSTLFIQSACYITFRIPKPPRAELFTSWTPVQDDAEALETLLRGSVDPSHTAVVELGAFGLQPRRGPPGGTASFRWLGPQEARIDVDSPGLAALVVRNSYDPNWHATMDGHPVSLLHVARGAADAYAERDIMLWDVAAGIAIVQGAGGRVRCASGSDAETLDVYADNGALDDTQ